MAHVLFVCLHNAGRSQISQALFQRAAAGRHTAESAGTTPAERVHPEVVPAMRELGIDLADRHPKLLTHQLAEPADVVVTMGCGDLCPYIPGKRYLDWNLPDPKDRPIAEVRKIRDEIDTRVTALIAQLDSMPISLPMAISGCSLDTAALGQQAEDYKQLGRSATQVERPQSERLEVTFAATVDQDLISRAIAVERECCSFLTLDYDASTRRLSVLAEPGRVDALDAICDAIGDGLSTTGSRRSR